MDLRGAPMGHGLTVPTVALAALLQRPFPVCNRTGRESLSEMPAGFAAQKPQTLELSGFGEFEVQSIEDDLADLLRQARRGRQTGYKQKFLIREPLVDVVRT
jgi:hypothetical protein